MRSLSGLDASFLALETSNAPMHIAGVSVFDPALPDGGRFGDDHLRRLIGSRLERSRALRERLAEAPLGIARPSWIFDPDFDLDRHIEPTTLPEPGGWRELRALMSWEMSQPVPRDRPLWQMVVADTLAESPEILPFSLGGLAARLYTRMQLADRHRPIFNLVITNVPGPQVPLYVAGARLLHHLGAAPIFDGLGLTLAIFSDAGELAIGAVACRRLVPDLELLMTGLEASLDELAAAVSG